MYFAHPSTGLTISHNKHCPPTEKVTGLEMTDILEKLQINDFDPSISKSRQST